LSLFAPLFPVAAVAVELAVATAPLLFVVVEALPRGAEVDEASAPTVLETAREMALLVDEV
jgi:hypothetical protein